MHTVLPSTQEIPNNARRQGNDKRIRTEEATFPVVLSFFFLFFIDCIIENLRDSTI